MKLLRISPRTIDKHKTKWKITHYKSQLLLPDFITRLPVVFSGLVDVQPR